MSIFHFFKNQKNHPQKKNGLAQSNQFQDSTFEPQNREHFINNDELNPPNHVQNNPYHNRREYFRVELKYPLEGNMTIDAFQNKKVTLGHAKILIKDIGPGGIRFLSNLKIVNDANIFLKINTILFDQSVDYYGNIVWAKEKETGLYEYGLKFLMEEEKRVRLISILNQLNIELRRKNIIQGCSFYTERIDRYFSS